jgi:membrane-bound metal-dependent hydrolase YbcI (DUF457 family)
MFIGHFGVGFASKRLAPGLNLGVLLVAPLLLDMLWPIFLLLGIESVKIDPGNTAVTPLDLHDYPWSHSLLMSLVWSVLAAAAIWAVLRRLRPALVVGAGVFSHWILDFITHRPDMPLYPGSQVHVGLGLWNSKIGTALVESAIYAAGVAIYLRATRRKDRTGAWAFASMAALLALIYAANFNGPPPPSVNAIIVVSFVLWLFIPWAAWADRHRVPVGEAR